MRPYIVQQDGHTNPNLWGATEADRPPTSSPPLEFLRGAVDLRIFNNASADLPVRVVFLGDGGMTMQAVMWRGSILLMLLISYRLVLRLHCG